MSRPAITGFKASASERIVIFIFESKFRKGPISPSVCDGIMKGDFAVYRQSLELKRQAPMASKATLTPNPANQISERKFA